MQECVKFSAVPHMIFYEKIDPFNLKDKDDMDINDFDLKDLFELSFKQNSDFDSPQ